MGEAAHTAVVTVLITTRNRRDELRTALRSAEAQTVPAEILVVDDGSTDGTAEMVRAEFPLVRVIRHEASRGYIARRNEGVREASGSIVVSIDDDAAFSTPDVVRQTLDEFGDARVGAVAIPYVDVRRDSVIRQQTPDAAQVYATDRFIGTAHAVRRDVFLGLAGYREHLVHQGEEGDFCVRMLAAGFIVRLGCADPVHHFESTRRSLDRMDFYGVRNAVLFAWQNVPAPEVLAHMPAVMFRCLVLTFEPRRFWTRACGIANGLWRCTAVERQPVPRSVYRLARSLAAGPRPLGEVLRALPPMAASVRA